jgi:hypothetical protein
MKPSGRLWTPAPQPPQLALLDFLILTFGWRKNETPGCQGYYYKSRALRGAAGIRAIRSMGQMLMILPFEDEYYQEGN